MLPTILEAIERLPLGAGNEVTERLVDSDELYDG
jgi:hypothetical protein